jgi:activating signal cointegrator complex subunit 3
LIATSTLAWGVNFPARLVIIKGTEFFDPKTHRYVDFPATDLLQMIGRAGRPQFDNKGVAVVYCEQSKKMFYRRYLNDPFPIESSLIEQVDDHINAEIVRGTIGSKQECINWFTWSYAFRRILKNPNFYSIDDNKNDTIKKFLIGLVDKSVTNLVKSKCIEAVDDENSTLRPTPLGFVASAYYLKHQTVKYFNDQLKEKMTFKDMLWMICHA